MNFEFLPPSINTNNRTPFGMRLLYENQFQIQSLTPAPYL